MQGVDALGGMGASSAMGRPADRARRGFTLIELVLAVTVFVIGFGAIVSTMVTTSVLNESNREHAVALEAAESALDALRAETFEEAFARFNATPGDDPADGSSPGNVFDVPGLGPQAIDPDGIVGEITFPGDGVALRENAADRSLGMPRDLDGDGDVDASDCSTNYRLLPVRVRVRWAGRDGNRSIELETVLTAL